MGRYPSFFRCNRISQALTSLLLFVFLFGQLTFLEFLLPSLVEAAVVVVDATTSATVTSHLFAGSQTVFISDQVGYKFYRDSTDDCVYSKTTTGGSSWGAAVIIDGQTDCLSVAVWYDQWTSGDSGTNIHIVTMDATALYYNQLDTVSDTRLLGTAAVNITSNSGQTASFSTGVNYPTISKGTTGVVYVATSDASDSFVISCSGTCDSGSNWNEVGTSFMDLDNDWNILMPLTGGSMLLINRDISLDDIRSRVWSGSSWSASWSVLDSNAVENSTYDVGMAAVTDPSNGDVYLAYAADHNNNTTDHDVRTAKFSSGSWSNTTDVFTNYPGRVLHEVAIALDINTSTIYVAYTMRTTPNQSTSANVYYSTSTSAMSAWGTEQGPVNSVSGNLYGIDLNIMSDERIYATWHDPSPDDIFGETIADIAPDTKLSILGDQTASISASSSGVHIGGTFVLKESQASRNVTDIVISERGTIAGQTDIANIKLLYDLDTSAPYDCVSESYGGGEAQFGTTDFNGFSGADGVASFSDVVSISTTQSMCIYVVLDVLDSALDGDTLAVSIENPANDVLVSGGVTVTPSSPVRFVTDSLVINDELTMTHFHWRNDNGDETAATSATGGVEDTAILALQINTPKRLRIGVSNEGTLTSAATNFRLEYAEAAPTCNDVSGWTDVGATDDSWNMYDSSFVSNGANTNDIAIGSGGVTNENTSFLVSNGGLLDTSSQTGGLTLDSTNFVELEFSIVASTTAVEGATYCFRVSDAGADLSAYNVFPSVTIAADMSLSTIGTQTASLIIPSIDAYIGGAFVLRENISSRNVTSITITENGSVDASVGLNNIRLFYDLDTSAPYDCVSESYTGGEAQFGSIDTDGFSAANGSSTFTGSVTVTTTQAMCVYVVADVTSNAQNADIIEIEITSGTSDIGVSSGSVSPSTPILLSSSTALAGAILEQTHYHWRNDDNTEVDATSATGGIEDTILTEHPADSPIRLRVGINNSGAATSPALAYRLEFGPKVTTCSAVSVWTAVGDATDDWDMYNSANLTDGDDATNIGAANGGLTDENATFLSNNNGVKDTTSTTSAITLTSTEFTELEFSITSTAITAFNTTYCFRLTNDNGTAMQYEQFPEITTAPKRDFKVQRGVTVVSGTSATLTAGVDYVAPASNTSAFVRITNTHNTGAGRDTSGGGAQNADDVTAYIGSAANLTTNFVINRPANAVNNTRVAWELVEFVGDVGTDNEMVVRDAGTISMLSTDLSGIGSVVSGVTDDSDVVVYITGIGNGNTGRNFYYAGQVSSAWDDVTDQPSFTRGASGAALDVSYAVVEYTGINWKVQRAEHTYSAVDTTETESIAPVNSLARTFIHTQKRMAALGNVNNYGHEVWLSSIGAVSFRLEAGATTPSGHVSVVWIVENQQTSSGAMRVQRTNGATNAGTEPVTINISIFTPIESTANASIFSTSRVVGSNTTFPLVFASMSIVSTTTYELWRSEASGELTYRTEIVEWPVNGLAVRQNYYSFYVDNDALTPTDPWPVGVADLGENTSITALDEPLGDGDRVRLRMSLRVANANLPAGLYNFKLQYGLRVTASCTAIDTWTDVGAPGSGVIWRGYNAPSITDGISLSGNPPTGGELLLSVADVAGSYTESNPSPTNPFLVAPGEDIEYDWNIEHNGANERSFYCFRMILGDDNTLDGYFNYPQIRTAGFSPATQNWRWYDDVENETPSTGLAGEEIAPTEVQNANQIALRVTVKERKNVKGQDIKFKLQYDEDPNFTNPLDVVATSTCNATSTWCYTTSTAQDNDVISTAVLTDADACIAGVGNGCGTHNTSADFISGDIHEAGTSREYAFYLTPAAARVGAVYYFRLYELQNDLPVAPNTGKTYPSLVAETAKLVMTLSGLPSGTSTAGIMTDATSTPTGVSFGSLPLNTDIRAAHRVTIDTNATQGYTVLMFARQQLLNSYGTDIASITGTNAVPVGWSTGCSGSADGCFGYHTTDATLAFGSTRFAPLDSYAGLHTTPAEIMYSSIPAVDIHDIVYTVKVGEAQPAGTYETEMIYLAIPTY